MGPGPFSTHRHYEELSKRTSGDGGAKTKFQPASAKRESVHFSSIVFEHYQQKMWDSYVEPKDRPQKSKPEPVVFVW